MAVAMVAIGGEVHVLGPSGARTIPLGGLHRLPGDEPERDTVLGPGDLITAVELTPLRFARRSRYRKVRDRASFSFAVASLAAAVDVGDGKVRECRIAFGGLAHAPWRALRAEELLRGAPATQESFARAADAELEQAQPLRDNAFKVPLARNLMVRTLSDLCEAP
jgi:xanthine dehydrogenase YagS FAD-binding subunit